MTTPATAAGRALPPHTRLILVAEDILSLFGSRTLDGYRISAEWGEQKPEGWYEPTFTVHYDDDLKAEARQQGIEQGEKQERERIRAGIENLVPFEPKTLAAADEMFFDPDADHLIDWHEVLAIIDAPEAQK